MARIEVEESALESIKAMAKRLQEERDKLLAALKNLVSAQENRNLIYDSKHWSFARKVIDRCTTTPKVME